MLVNQQNRNILSLLRKLVESAFDVRVLGFGIDDEVVFLCVWWVCDMLF